MQSVLRSLLVLSLAALLSGCGGAEEAREREAAALQQLQQERGRRELWQALTYASSVLAVVLLITGVALGSRSRHHAGQPQP